MNAGRGRCDVYLARLSMLDDDAGSLLSEQERSRASRYRFAADRTRFVLGAVLLRAAAGQALGIAAASVLVGRDCAECGEPHGRPRIVDGDVHLSVSHSGDVVAVALTRQGPVGVDVEAVADRTSTDHQEICPSVCTVDEQPFATDRHAFLTFWTRKEAVLKATGHGLRMPMTDVGVTPPAQEPSLVAFPGGSLPACEMTDLDVGEGYCGAVALLTATSVDFAVHDAGRLLLGV